MEDDIYAKLASLEERLEESTLDHPERASTLDQVAQLYASLYAISTEDAHLQLGIMYMHESLDLTPKGDSQRRQRILDLGLAYMKSLEADALEDDSTLINQSQDAEDPDSSDVLHHMARLEGLMYAFHKRFRESGDRADFEATVKYGYAFVKATLRGQPAGDGVLPFLAKLYRGLFEATKNINDLQIAIVQISEMVDAGTFNQDDLAYGYYTLGILHGKMSQILRNNANSENALEYFTQAIGVMPFQHPERLNCLSELGLAYRAKFERSRDLLDLDSGIDSLRQVCESDQIEDFIMTQNLYRLALCYRDRFNVTQDLSDLESSHEQVERARTITADDHPFAMKLRTFRCDILMMKHERTKDIEDLDMAIEGLKELVETTKLQDPSLLQRIANLGIVYQQRFMSTKQLPDVDECIRLFEQVYENTEAFHPLRTKATITLAESSSRRHEITQTDEHCNIAMRWMEEAVAIMPRNNRDRLTCIAQLSHLSRAKYKSTGLEADLEPAIQKSERLLGFLPSHHPQRTEDMEALADLYYKRYNATQQKESDLKRAIELYQASIKTTPTDCSNRSLLLYKTGTVYISHFWEAGTVGSLEASIPLLHEALTTLEPGSSVRRDMLEKLGIAYESRYKFTSAIVDLDAAIDLLAECLDLTPKDHDDRGRAAFALARIYEFHYSRGDGKDLDKCAYWAQEALSSTPKDSQDRSVRLELVGRIFLHKYRRNKDMKDLEESVSYIQEAIKLPLTALEEQHHLRANQLRLLGSCYTHKCLVTSNTDHLELSTKYRKEGLDKRSQRSPYRADHLYELGLDYMIRFEWNSSEEDRETAMSYFQEAVDEVASMADCRLRAARILMRLYVKKGKMDSAYEVANTAMSLVPMLTSRSLENSDRQHILTDITGLASEAVGIALLVRGSAFEAIQMLELGRGVIMGSMNEIRADVTDLKTKHPALAADYIRNRDLLDNTAGIDYDPISSQQGFMRRIDQRYNAAKDLESNIQAIRQLPEFKRFLLSPMEEELRQAASSSPIVVINVSQFRCDALVVEKTGLRVIELRRLHLQLIRQLEPLLTSTSTINTRLLEWLWDCIGEPVLDGLGFTQTPCDTPWPRVRWILTGPLSKFPIHAAGYHQSSDSHSVIDRVVSSYELSLRSAVQSSKQRFNSFAAESKRDNIVLVSAGNLMYAAEEVDRLSRLCSSMQVQMPKPSYTEVSEALKQCDIFHFAGHGYTDGGDPSKSALILENKETLPLSSLYQINLQHRRPFLAYLSACGTGRIKNELFDEGLHLMAGFQLAGFQHVIGTLWDVDDRVCAEMASLTYKWMQEHRMSDESVSEGLHHATRKLRDQWFLEDTMRRTYKSLSDNGSRIHDLISRDVSKPDENTSTGDSVSGELLSLHLVSEKQSSSEEGHVDGQEGERDGVPKTLVRDITGDDFEESPIHWIAYVHFGI